MGSLPGNKDGAVAMDKAKASESDAKTTDDQSPDSTTSKLGKNTSYSNTSCVKGSENSTVTDSTVIGAVYNSTINHGEKQREGISCNISEGAKPKVKISVPAEDGGTLIHVDCTNGKVRHWSYCRNVDIEKTFGSTWTFGNIFDGFMATVINGEIGDAFFDLIGKWKELYDCKLYKVYKKCLVIEFLHETEEGRNNMIQEQETVRQMFQKFMESVKPDAPVSTLEVKEIETPTVSGQPDTASKCTEQDVSLSLKSTSERTRTPEMSQEFKLKGEIVYVDDDDDDDDDFSRYRSLIEEVPAPCPLQQVDRTACRRCSDLLRDCEDDLSTFKNIFMTHWTHDLISPYVKITKLRFLKVLTSLRNSHGGVLIVHAFGIRHSEDFYKFIDHVFDSIPKQDVVPCEVFKTKEIENYENMFRIEVEPSDMFVTLDYKTKFPSLFMDKFENASNEKVRHLLFSSRTTESTGAVLGGVSTKQQNQGALRLNCHKDYEAPPWGHVLLGSLVDEIIRLSVPQHISALSKKKCGGTIFVVMSVLQFDAIPLDRQKHIKDYLMQALMKKLRFQKNKHSKVSPQDSGVFDVALSKDEETGDCSIEIAVGHFNGCVFYDPEGPLSYKIEGDTPVRLPFEKWIEEAFD